jgi:hypothetical protein
MRTVVHQPSPLIPDLAKTTSFFALPDLSSSRFSPAQGIPFGCVAIVAIGCPWLLIAFATLRG